MVVLGQYGAKSLNMEKENLWWHRRTDQKGEYSAICLFEGWKIEHRNLGTIRLVSEEKSLSSVIYAKDPHLVADIFKVCSILTPPHPISRGRLRASKPAWIKPPVNLSYLSLQNCLLCPSGLSAPPEEFLLASLARRLPPCLTFAQWEPCPGKQYLIQVGKHNTTVTSRFASFPQYFRVLV